MLRKTISLFIIVLSCIFFGSSALASEVTGTKGESSVLSVVGPEAMQWLADGSCSITNNMNGSVTISGKTTAYSSVDVISVTLYLQKKVGTSWVTQGSWIFEDYGTNMVTGSKIIAVNSGAYYRTYALHSINESGIKESGSSTSSSVYVK